jgi:hypothetical protein
MISCAWGYLFVRGFSIFRKAKDKDETSAGIHIPADSPPIFPADSSDDTIGDTEQRLFANLALGRAGIPAEFHIDVTGNRDFGVHRNESSYRAGRNSASNGCEVRKSSRRLGTVDDPLRRAVPWREDPFLPSIAGRFGRWELVIAWPGVLHVIIVGHVRIGIGVETLRPLLLVVRRPRSKQPRPPFAPLSIGPGASRGQSEQYSQAEPADVAHDGPPRKCHERAL